MKKLINVIGLFIILVLASCTDAGTTVKYSGIGEDTIAPCIIDGDTIPIYLYYVSTGNPIYISKYKNSISLNTTGKGHKTNIIITEDDNRYIKGEILLENDSIIILKKK